MVTHRLICIHQCDVKSCFYWHFLYINRKALQLCLHEFLTLKNPCDLTSKVEFILFFIKYSQCCPLPLTVYVQVYMQAVTFPNFPNMNFEQHWHRNSPLQVRASRSCWDEHVIYSEEASVCVCVWTGQLLWNLLRFTMEIYLLLTCCQQRHWNFVAHRQS